MERGVDRVLLDSEAGEDLVIAMNDEEREYLAHRLGVPLLPDMESAYVTSDRGLCWVAIGEGEHVLFCVISDSQVVWLPTDMDMGELMFVYGLTLKYAELTNALVKHMVDLKGNDPVERANQLLAIHKRFLAASRTLGVINLPPANAA